MLAKQAEETRGVRNALFLFFPPDKKNFDQDGKVSHRNGRWLCTGASEVLTMIHMKFLLSIIVLAIVNVGDVLLPHLFLEYSVLKGP